MQQYLTRYIAKAQQMILLNATLFDKMYYKGLANDIEGKFKYNVLQKNFKPWMQCNY
jgi:hypothetical protein